MQNISKLGETALRQALKIQMLEHKLKQKNRVYLTFIIILSFIIGCLLVLIS